MLLPLLIIVVASVALYLAWKTCKNTTEKTVVISSYLLVLAICYKYMSLLKLQAVESFVVEMPDIDEMFEEELENASKNESAEETTTTAAAEEETTTTAAAEETTTTAAATVTGKNNNSPVKFKSANDAQAFGREDLSGVSAMVKGANGPTTEFSSTETTRPMTSAGDSFGDLPGPSTMHTDHMSTDEFSNISQEKTDGMSSVFNPQIIINNPGGVTSGASGEYTDYYSPERFTGPQSGSPDGKSMPSNTIRKYLEPDSSLFSSYDNTYLNKYDNSRQYSSQRGDSRASANNGFQNNNTANDDNSNSESNNNGANNNSIINNSTSNEWDITKNLIANNKASPNSGNNNKTKSTGSCTYEVSRPFAEENGKFNTTTLNNKSFVPGMSYLPPTEWSVPQYHPTTCRGVCPTSMPNTRELPIGIMDHGTPIFALEIGSDGNIAKTEDEVTLTNVGSICPKFVYREYVECPSQMYTGRKGPLTTLTKPKNE